MRVLILGKDGMLGHDLMKVFEKEDFIGLSQKDLDITQKDDVFEKFITIQPDVVINATGYTNVDLAEKESEKANAINGYAVGVLASACREIDAIFVHFSTDYVFNGTQPGGYKEEDKTDPLNAYGRSKLLGEKLLIEEMELQVNENQPEGKYFLIRTSWLFGKHGKNFVDTMLKTGKSQDTLKIIEDQRGKPTYTLDLAEQVKWLIKSHEYPSDIYHITNEGITSWYEFAEAIFSLAKMKVNVLPCGSEEYPREARRPHYSGLINTKLPALRPWKEALQAYLDSL